jgi:hypothetical protein
MYKILKKSALRNLIEPHFEKDIVKDTYEVIKINANKLLTHKRFDLAFKLLYLEMMNKNVKFAKEIYKEHIRAFSLGKFTEPGNENKNSVDRFIEEFHKTFEDIRTNGFDSSKTVIPLSKNGSIANGVHRVASALYLGKDIDCVEIESANHIYDYKFFYSRNVSVEMLDIAATKYIEYAKDIYVAFLWPTAKGNDAAAESAIPNIVYRKEITLTTNGAHNLLSQIYYGEKWLGSIENDFKGSKGKLVECFKNFDPLRVIAFQANSLDEVIKIKDDVRAIFNVGKHSIHITDTKEEAIRVAKVAFNENSIHFLNHAKPNKYISTHKKIKKFKVFLEKNQLNSKDIVLDSGIVLSAYGLREASDIDYFLDDNKKLKYKDEEFEYHDDQLEYHDEEKLELIYNPKNYFYFKDLKFLAFKQLSRMKKNRNEEKDRNDYKMMEALMENNGFKKFINKWKQKFFYGRIKAKFKLLKFLDSLGLLEKIKKIVRG